MARGAGGLAVGRSPGEAWAKGRFEAPYLRDELLTHGVMVETLETATQWSNVQALHGVVTDAIAQALRECQSPGMVMCHVSHLYETGSSLYFTFLARQREGEEISQWRDHAPWRGAEVGETGVAALRALKHELDPAGIMNPGKLLPSA
jgi:alkyldihydroxyacetonephosphate synthase